MSNSKCTHQSGAEKKGVVLRIIERSSKEGVSFKYTTASQNGQANLHFKVSHSATSWKHDSMIYKSLEDDLIDASFSQFDEKLHLVLGEIKAHELRRAGDSAYTHLNGMLETVRDMTGSKPSASHIRDYVAMWTDLTNPTVASALISLLTSMAMIPPKALNEERN
ncbi:hypothetical protein [Acidiphilium sp. JA12-A1]|uniref:hypothetical protein n=1 Tax=Acidiphilium sp. JA12-A1 TaxID=1464546 RepID=UPI00128E9C7E|nr:hypothetical protein [Acidiphilium sp. JA12-A1]